MNQIAPTSHVFSYGPAGAAGLAGKLRTRSISLAVKRVGDLFLAVILLIVLAPLFACSTMLVLVSSRGPIIFKQKRVGRHGTEFWFYKFRTMVVHQSDTYSQAVHLNGSGILFKTKNDPRVTPIGKWLRRFSLDELPQLVNVIKGDMSMVGPRPLVPFMLEPYPEFAAARSLMKPGITGLWQLRARQNNTSAVYMLEHDLEYIQNFSLLLDLEILCSTPKAVFLGRGAV
jgi:exopolysaccharide production protein ExoY